MTDHAAAAGPNGEYMQEPSHLVPVRVYLTVFSLLLVLTAVTVGVSFLDLGRRIPWWPSSLPSRR